MRSTHHLVAIGSQPRFPLPELLTAGDFPLRGTDTRQWGTTQVQPIPDGEGIMTSVISPWNNQRVVLALGGRDDTGLAQVADLLRHDPLFYQIEGDTVLVSAQVPDPDPYTSADYHLTTLRQSPQVQLSTTVTQPWLWQITRHNWLLILPATVAMALLLYGATQAALRRGDGLGGGEFNVQNSTFKIPNPKSPPPPRQGRHIGLPLPAHPPLLFPYAPLSYPSPPPLADEDFTRSRLWSDPRSESVADGAAAGLFGAAD